MANRIPQRMKSDSELHPLVKALLDEVENDYIFSLRKAIGKSHIVENFPSSSNRIFSFNCESFSSLLT